MAFDGTLKFDTAIDKTGFKLGIDSLQGIAKSGMSLITSAFSMADSAISDLGKFSIDVGKDFEAGMSQVAATLGYSVETLNKPLEIMSAEEKQAYENMENLSAKAKEMGAATSFSASQAADGLNILAMSGYSAEESIGMIENVLHLAEAGSLSLSDAASFAAGSMKGFVSEASNFADVTQASAYYSDLIAKGATLAATDVAQLGTALSQASATADSYRQSSTETEVALLRLAEQNVTGSAAATALSAAMKNLYSPTDTAKKALESLGVSAYDSSGKAKNFNAVVDDLNKALSSLSDEDRASLEDAIFGIQGKDAFDKMVASSGDKVQGFYDGIANASGSAALQSETMLDNLQGKLTIFQSASEGFGIAIYESLNDPLKELVEVGTGYVEQLTKAFNEGGFDGLANAFGDVLADAVNVISGYIPKITDVAVSIAKAFLDGITKNSGDISKSFSQTITKILSGISQIIPKFFTAGADVIYNLLDGFSEALPELLDTAVSGISELAVSLTEGSSKLLEIGSQLILNLADGIVEKLPELSAIASNIITSISETIVENFPAIITAGIEIIETLGTVILENLPVIVESAISIIQMLCDTLLTPENLEKLLSAGYKILTTITQTIIDNLPELIEIAIQIIEFLCSELLSGDNIASLLDTAFRIIIALTNAIVDNIDEILMAAEQIIKTLCDELLKPENFEKILKVGIELLKELIAGLCELGGKFVGFAALAFEEIGKALKDIKWKELGTAIVEGICSGLLDCDFVLDEYLSEFGDNWLTGIKDIFDIHSPSKLMKNEVGKYLALGVGEGFGENADQIGQQILDSVSEWTSILPSKSQESANNFSENTVSVFRNLPSQISKYLENSLDISKQWGIGIADIGKNTSENFLSSVTANFKKFPDISVKIFTETSNKISAWGSDLVNRGAKISSDLVSKIVDGVSSLPARMYTVGKNLAEGLWNGVSGCGNWLRSRIYDFSNEITASFRGAFGIHSPSTVMRDGVGKYLAQGIGVGFNEEIPDIAKTALESFENIKISIPELDKLNIPETEPLELSFDVPEIDIPELEISVKDIEIPDLKINPNIEPENIKLLENQSLNLNSGLVQPSATSEIVNNTYNYSSSTTNHSENPQNIVLNAQFSIDNEVIAEGMTNIISDQVDESQGIKIQLKRRGLAR